MKEYSTVAISDHTRRGPVLRSVGACLPARVARPTAAVPTAALSVPSDAGKTHYFKSLESLRGVAALIVVLFHVGWLTPLYNLGLVRNGYLMVDCFFILSGFVICHSYWGKIRSGADTTRFLWLRIGRLYPLHFVLVFVALGMECAKYYAQIKYGITSVYGAFVATNAYSFLTNLLLIHDWGFHDAPSYNTPSWSISAEFFVNIVFCLIMLCTRSIRNLVLVSIALIIAGLSTILASDSIGLTGIMDCGVARCVVGFFLGVLVYQAFRASPKTKAPGAQQNNIWSNALPFGFGMMLLTLLSVKTPGGSDFLLLPIAAGFLLFLVRAPGGLADRWLTLKPISWLGKISYSIYLVHYPILWVHLQAVRVILKAPVVTIGPDKVPVPNGIVGLLLVASAIGSVLLVSHFSFKWIEEPFRKKSKELAARWFAERDTPEAAAAPKWTPPARLRIAYVVRRILGATT
jgi:peptidoglycan/LPS O-acetylase OafA/YrhL